MTTLAPATLATMRHLKVHGLSTRAELRKAVPDISKSTLPNLIQSRYAVADNVTTDTRYVLTPRGINRLQDEEYALASGTPVRRPTKPRNDAPGEPQAMASNAETERSIIDTLRRAGAYGITLPEVARRLHQAEGMIRPAITTLVQAGTVRSGASKPTRYSLPEHHSVGARAGTRAVHNAARSTSHYAGTELQRNPGIGPERYAAFELPSRMGDRLHYPDGRVLPMPNMRGVA